MALKATVFRVELQVADMDRQHYADYNLTLARHPSETDERMMVRLLAYALHAHERLEFGRGVSTDEDPDLWQRDLTGAVERWIELGQPEEKRLRQACGRAERVHVYTYSGHGAELWWAQNAAGLQGLDRLAVSHLPPEQVSAMAGLARRGMRLQANIQDGTIWLGDGERTVQIEPLCVQHAAAG